MAFTGYQLFKKTEEKTNKHSFCRRKLQNNILMDKIGLTVSAKNDFEKSEKSSKLANVDFLENQFSKTRHQI